MRNNNEQLMTNDDLDKLFADDDKCALICHRISQLPIPGCRSTKQECAKCKEAVWTSPASMMHAGAKAVIICNVCAMPLVMKHGETKFMEISEGQARESGMDREEVNGLLKDFIKRLRQFKESNENNG